MSVKTVEVSIECLEQIRDSWHVDSNKHLYLSQSVNHVKSKGRVSIAFISTGVLWKMVGPLGSVELVESLKKMEGV